MSDFLFHNVSEEEKGEIKAEAKNIMDSFSKKLAKVEKNIPEPLIERDDFEREERNSSDNVLDLIERTKSFDFKKRIFENAPNKDGDFIVAEKKSW